MRKYSTTGVTSWCATQSSPATFSQIASGENSWVANGGANKPCESLLWDQSLKTSERTQLGVTPPWCRILRTTTSDGMLIRPAHLDKWGSSGVSNQARHSRPHDAVGHSAQLHGPRFEDCQQLDLSQ